MTVSESVQAALAVFAGAALLVVLNEAQKRLWARGYFGVGRLLTGFGEESPGAVGIVARASIPFLAGTLAALTGPSDEVALAGIAALVGSLAISWPVLLSMEAIPAELYGRERELRLLHVMYAATAALLGLAGGLAYVVVAAVGGTALLDFGGDVLRGLAVDAVKAAVLLGLGALGMRVIDKRSARIREDAVLSHIGESDTP